MTLTKQERTIITMGENKQKMTRKVDTYEYESLAECIRSDQVPASEVAEIFEVPLSFLMDAKNHKKYTKEFKGENRQFYAMPYGKHFIWGATAGMLINLHSILTEP